MARYTKIKAYELRTQRPAPLVPFFGISCAERLARVTAERHSGEVISAPEVPSPAKPNDASGTE